MLQAFNTGHDGGLSTAHGNSASDILGRLEMMVLMGMELPLAAIRQQIASGIDLIVHLGRLSDKSRRIVEITEIDGMEDGEIRLHTMYRLAQTEGGWRLEAKDGLLHTEKLAQAGLMEFYETWRERGEAHGLPQLSAHI